MNGKLSKCIKENKGKWMLKQKNEFMNEHPFICHARYFFEGQIHCCCKYCWYSSATHHPSAVASAPYAFNAHIPGMQMELCHRQSPICLSIVAAGSRWLTSGSASTPSPIRSSSP